MVTLASAPRRAYPQLAQRDSLRLLEYARKAQNAFEVYRRAHLPRSQPRPTQECQEQIGRLCYWHNETDSIVPETKAITKARDQLLRTLDHLSAQSRADEWINGQRVRYLVEAGYDSSAMVASRECWSKEWWCAVLRGFALHAAQRYEAAEITFDSALALMPDDERCKWTDISLLLRDEERDAYKKLPCDQRGDFEKHFWQLADPSYSIPGNDRRTEHFSRVLIAELSEDATNAYGMRWGDDMRELLIRYGMPVSYSTYWAPGIMQVPLVGHEREPSYHFAAIDATSDTTRWNIRDENARERYSPPYINKLNDLDAQFAMFRRGDSALVVAIYADTGSGSGSAVLGVMDSTNVSIGRDSTSGARVRIARTAWKGVVAGVEQYDGQTRIARRARAWLEPPVRGDSAPALSTMLFFNGDDTTAVSSLSEAMSRALTASELRGTRKLGVYWESYGSEADSAIGVSLTVKRTGVGFFQHFAQALHISQKDSPIAVAWHDVPGPDGMSYRSVVLDLAELPAGDYRVTLAVGPDADRRSMTVRDIKLQ